MDEIRRQITEELTDSLSGEVRLDDVTTALYATDGSLYEIKPAAVAFPADTADVSTLAAFASRNAIPVIPRGSGTGIAGGCLGNGIVVDFSRYMNEVISIGDETVRVQPGITLAELNRRLRPTGRYFPPDPSSAQTTTIGGMIGVDAAGSHAFRVGSTRDHLASLQCVLMGGQTLELAREQVARRFTIRQPEPGNRVAEHASRIRGIVPPVPNASLPLVSLTPIMRKADLTERISALLTEADTLIRDHQPVLLRNSSGYMLRNLLQKDQLDLTRLIAGSEGTLAMVTEATLHTMPLMPNRGALVLMFASMDAAIQAMQQLLVLEPGACDLMDRRLLSLGRDDDPRFRSVVHPEAEAGLFVEFNGHSRAEVEQRIQTAESMMEASSFQYAVTQRALDAEEVDLLWRLPARVVSLLAGLKGNSRPLPFVEDVAVPPESISEFLVLAQRTFQKHEVTATLYAHAASGQLHLRPMLPVPNRSQGPQLEAIARDLYRHVRAMGGAISGEHGDGLSRTAFLRSMYGPLYRTFQQVKQIFDPQYLLNPDKIISNDGQLTQRYLRRISVTQPSTTEDPETLLPILQLSWDEETAMQAAIRCNGCGSCRTQGESGRMCPFFHHEAREENSPRSKASLLRRVLSGEESADVLTSGAAGAVLDSCFNCKQCLLECPSEADIPHMMLEARAQNVALNGLGKTDWLLSKFHTYTRFASRFRRLTNRMLRHGIFRTLLQKTIGIARDRRLPRFQQRPFLHSPRVQSEHNSANVSTSMPTVVYFVDYFANHHDPELAEAFVRILQHNGFRVYIPPQQTVSGMAMVAVGDMQAAREVADANIACLSESARDGYPIICTEPSAALCLRDEYPLLSASEDAAIVSQRTQDAGTFLWQLHAKGSLKTDFEPVEVTAVYHTPCHVKALGPEAGLYRVLELIPGVEVRQIEKGCSGMAGMFGIAAEHFEQSLEIGKDLIQEMATVDVSAGMTDCSTCRMQMEQGASIPTVHPIKILALAYGLMPELRSSLSSKPAGYLMS